MHLSPKKRILFFFLIGSFAVLILEGAVRLLRPDRTPEPVVPTCLGRWDAELGWSLVPNSHASSSRTGHEIDYRINSHGLRDDDTPYAKPPGTFRIVLLGDSRAFGYGVPIDKHFSTIIEGYFRDLEVINMGVSGYGIDQQLLYLLKEGFRYEPDLVIAYVAHFGAHRHMHTSRFGKDKPCFVLIDGELVLTNSPVRAPVNRRDSGILATAHSALRENSRAYAVLGARLAHLLTPRTARASQQTEHGTTLTPAEADATRERVHMLAEAIIRTMDEESHARRAAFVLVTQIEEFHRAVVESGIHSFDVSIPLSNPHFLLPRNLLHVNESGNGVLAWEIAGFLEANHLIPEKHVETEHSGKLR